MLAMFESVDSAMSVMRQCELEDTSKFLCFKADKMFGAGGKVAYEIYVIMDDISLVFVVISKQISIVVVLRLMYT